MSNPIRSYEDLLEAEEGLMRQLRSSEVLIRNDLKGIEESLQPLGKLFNFLNKIATRDRTGPLANFSLDFGIDLFVRKLLLARAGWFAKILVPFLIKNYSSHIISEEQSETLAKKIRDLFNKIRPKKNRAAKTAVF